MRVILIRSTEVMPDPPVEKMADALIGSGHEVKILAWERSESYRERAGRKQLTEHEAEIIHFGIPAVYCGGIKKNFNALWKFQCRIIGWLKKHRNEYDAVHAFDFDTGFAAMLCCRRYGKKFIYHVLDYYVDGHILPSKFLNSIVEFFEIRVINAADTTILCTEKRIEQIDKASPKKVYVIHNTPNTVLQPSTSFKLQSANDKMKIAYVGILAGTRLLKETVEAVAQMNDVEMHIGGFGKYEAWMQEAAQKYDNIFFYGKLQYSNTLALESQCDVMVATYDPSFRNHKYAAPNKFYESLMLGKPIIMAQDTGYDDVILEHDIGLLTEYSEDGIGSAIRALNKRRADWPEMGQRSRMLYDEKYSWEIMKLRIKALYQSMEK